MNATVPGGASTRSGETPLRVCIVANPRLFADSMARTVALSGWPVDFVCSDPSELGVFERTLTDRHVAVIADGVIPAVALAEEVRRRRPGQRVVVIGDAPVRADDGVMHVAGAAGVVDLVRSLDRLSGAAHAERQLTPRHVEILQLVARGCTTDEVGERLGIASKTVNNHLSAVYRRLRARNLTQAVLTAARAGLIDVSAI